MHAAAKLHGRSVMDRDEVEELHFITPIGTLGSILEHGILCHDRAKRLPHRSIASESVQDIRRGKSVPGGLSLHSYANLYFNARNPMMYCRKDEPDLVVVRVSPAVLDIPETVITDGNAADQDTRFFPSPEGLGYLNFQRIFATWWTDPDYWTYLEKKRVRNAEVLVPGLVPSEYIEGCYVDTQAKRRACQAWEDLPAVDVRREIFFR
jgi:ssDNA thymidine ADP-ribosyltransferase, DarT